MNAEKTTGSDRLKGELMRQRKKVLSVGQVAGSVKREVDVVQCG